MKAVIVDLFGASGGVGRCTYEILQQMEADEVPAVLVGQSHVVDSFRERLPAMQHLSMVNLEHPKFSLKSLKIKQAARNAAGSPRLADTLLLEARKAVRGQSATSAPILVNYPQIAAPPTVRSEFSILIHDLNWRLYPGNFPDPDLIDRNCRGWVDRAVKVIANSECTRDEIIERYACAPNKVMAAPLAPFCRSCFRRR